MFTILTIKKKSRTAYLVSSVARCIWNVVPQLVGSFLHHVKPSRGGTRWAASVMSELYVSYLSCSRVSSVWGLPLTRRCPAHLRPAPCCACWRRREPEWSACTAPWSSNGRGLVAGWRSRGGGPCPGSGSVRWGRRRTGRPGWCRKESSAATDREVFSY